MTLHETLAEAVLDEISNQGLRQRDVAERAGVSESTVSAVTVLKNQGRLWTWQAILDVLELEVVVRKKV